MDKIYSRKRLLLPRFRGKNRIIGNFPKSFGVGSSISFVSKTPENNVVHKSTAIRREGTINNRKNEKNFNRKLVKTSIVIIIAICIANRIISIIEPTMDVLCVEMARSIATKISNEQATVVMR